MGRERRERKEGKGGMGKEGRRRKEGKGGMGKEGEGREEKEEWGRREKEGREEKKREERKDRYNNSVGRIKLSGGNDSAEEDNVRTKLASAKVESKFGI